MMYLWGYIYISSTPYSVDKGSWIVRESANCPVSRGLMYSYTLLEKFWRIFLYVTGDDAITKF